MSLLILVWVHRLYTDITILANMTEESQSEAREADVIVSNNIMSPFLY